MEKEYYNKVCIAYQNLSERFQRYTKQYSNGYTVYDKNLQMFQGERGAFLQQFEEIPFNVFFKKQYLDKSGSPQFYDTATLQYGENSVSIHYDTYMVLFYSIVDKLKKNIETFIEVIKSEEFQQSFKGLVKNDEYSVRYSLSYHEQVFKYLSNNIPNFGFIYHLFHRTNSGIMQVEGNYMIISVEKIMNILKWNEEIYDFTKFEIV